MSQASVERVIGRLVTDEGFRRRFFVDPAGLLRELVDAGLELNWCELEVLKGLDQRAIARCAERIDPRIHKSDLACLETPRGKKNLRTAGVGGPGTKGEAP